MNESKAKDIINGGEITRINTLFPSKRSKKTGGVRGGIQLIKLKRKDNFVGCMNVELEVTFEDRYGKMYKNIQNVSFNSPKENRNNDMIEMDSDEKETEESNVNFYDN